MSELMSPETAIECFPNAPLEWLKVTQGKIAFSKSEYEKQRERDRARPAFNLYRAQMRLRVELLKKWAKATGIVRGRGNEAGAFFDCATYLHQNWNHETLKKLDGYTGYMAALAEYQASGGVVQ